MSPKTRAAGMLACTLPSCTDKCASTKVATIAQIESRAQACLSMTEMQAMTQSVNTMQGECRTTELAWLYDRTAGVTRSVNTLGIDAFGIRFGTSGHDRERVRDHDARLERSSPL